MENVYLPAFYLGVVEELEKAARCWKGYRPVPGKKPYSEDSCEPEKDSKKAEAVPLQTSVPGETPEQLLARVRHDNFKFPKFMQNAQQHRWNVPGVPFANSLIQGFLKDNSQTPEVIKNKISNQSDSTLLKVINKNPDAFRGVQNQPQPGQEASKIAFELDSMPSNENILPNINSQSKWKYVRTKNGLRLSDGNLVYNFGGFPEEFPGEDFRVNRLKDDNILDFEKDSIGKGTAQIHRSSPDNIYMTLADGARNPTFMLQHEEGQNWRYSPSKKFLEKLKALQAKTSTVLDKAEPSQEAPEYEKATLLDPESLFKGAEDFCKRASADPLHLTLGLDSDDLSNIIKSVGYGGAALGQGFINTATNHPIATGATLYGLTSGVSALRDMMSPERKAEREADPRKKLQHELGNIAIAGVPTLAAAALGTK
jgi:hypothetical protein